MRLSSDSSGVRKYGPKSVGILIPRDTFRAGETSVGARRATLLPAARNFSARPAKLLGRARNFWVVRETSGRRETFSGGSKLYDILLELNEVVENH